MTPRIVITPGEPAGIGPDICLQLVEQEHAAALLFVGDARVLRARARRLNLATRVEIVADPAAPLPRGAGVMAVWPVPCSAAVTPGRVDARNAPYVIRTLQRALALTRGGGYDAWVTGPVHKGVINDGGIAFSGHTEWLAQHTGARRAVMLLAGPGLRVALATTHLPLREVAAAITPQLLREVITVLRDDLRDKFHIAHPRIHVCGLNPHAGEGGHLGREELEVIAPVVEELRGRGFALQGPLPADTVFLPDALRDADAVLAMYHDQGLPVLKHAAFGNAVNLTLGLPIVRASVDHGTALGLAGSGRTDVAGLRAALAAAIELSAGATR